MDYSILFKNMHNKSRKTKNSMKELKSHQQERIKHIRNSATRTPKHLQNTNQRKSPQLSKFKSLPMKPQRQMTCSVLPPQIHFVDKENLFIYKAYKTNKTNTSALDLPYSHSQKTLTFHKVDQNNRGHLKGNQSSKKQRDRKSKLEQQAKIQTRGTLTTRKSSGKKLTLDILLRKTQRILVNYQKKQQQWVRQRQTLLQEIGQLKKKKNMGRALTSSTSSYINKRYLY